MAYIKQLGDTFRITVSLGYGMVGKPIRKIVSFRPPEGTSGSETQKLAEAFAQAFEEKCAASGCIKEEGMS